MTQPGVRALFPTIASARALAGLDPYIGELPGRRVYHDTLQPYVRAILQAGISPGTINRDLAVVRCTLNLAARLGTTRHIALGSPLHR